MILLVSRPRLPLRPLLVLHALGLLLAVPSPVDGRPRTELADLTQRTRAIAANSRDYPRELERVHRALAAARSSADRQRARLMRIARTRIQLLEGRLRVAGLRAKLGRTHARLVKLREEVDRQQKRLDQRKTHLQALRTMR